MLIGLLSAWAAASGAGTLTRVRIEVTLAAVPMRAFTFQGGGRHPHGGHIPDDQQPQRYPGRADRRAQPHRRARHARPERRPGGARTQVGGLLIPAHGTLTLSPLTDDAVLENPAPFEDRATVPLTLVFRDAGVITIDAPVTAPGTP